MIIYKNALFFNPKDKAEQDSFSIRSYNHKHACLDLFIHTGL